MFRHGDISTETDKGPFIFSAAALAGCTAAAVLILVLGKGSILGIFAAILLIIVAGAAGITLFAMVTDRAYIEDGALHMSYLFRKASVEITDIGRIRYKEDIYSVYGRDGELIGTINAKLTGIDRLIQRLDKAGVRFE